MSKWTVELPCRIGDTVWAIFVAGKNSHLLEYEVAGITFMDNRIFIGLGGTNRYFAYDYNMNLVKNSGEVYFSKEVAEARLKELQEKDE